MPLENWRRQWWVRHSSSAAVLMAPVVMGNIPGLEVLHPFAVTVLGGLVSSTVVVLLLVPMFLLGHRKSLRSTAGRLRQRANHETDVQA